MLINFLFEQHQEVQYRGFFVSLFDFEIEKGY